MGLISRLRQWKANPRRRAEDHERAWAPALERNEQGTANIQRQALEALERLLKAHGYELDVRLVRTGSDFWGSFYEGSIAEADTRVWIYDNTLSVSGPTVDDYIEHWDCDTPEEAIERFLGMVETNLEAGGRGDRANAIT